MKVSTIISKLEATAARSEQLWLEVKLSTGCYGELEVWSCQFRFDHYGADVWVTGQTFPRHPSDAHWRSMLSWLDHVVAAFLENQK